MTVTGVIAEYNPFHTGHLFHLSEARRLTGADYLVVVMSGDFVQRGEPALADKYARAEMALRCGADLVLELPPPFATGSAEYFARGAVSLLARIGIVDFLCFGSECGDPASLAGAARVLAEEPAAFKQILKAELRGGASFPAARERALAACLKGEMPAGLLSEPNNILALEYLKALYLLRSPIRPVTVQRRGGYHAVSLSGDFCSASAIRAALTEGKALRELSLFLPEPVLPILERSLSERPMPSLNNYTDILRYLLLSAPSPMVLAAYADISEELANRLFSLRGDFADAQDLIRRVKTRQYTYTRIARCLSHILLNIQEVPEAPSRARVLGFKKEAACLLSRMHKEGSLPVSTRPADGDLLASSVYHMHDKKPWEERSLPVLKI